MSKLLAHIYWNEMRKAWLKCLANWAPRFITVTSPEHNGISNHKHFHFLLKRLSRLTLKTASRIRVTGICEGNPPVISCFHSPLTRKIFTFHDMIMLNMNVKIRPCSATQWRHMASKDNVITGQGFGFSPVWCLPEPMTYQLVPF